MSTTEIMDSYTTILQNGSDSDCSRGSSHISLDESAVISADASVSMYPVYDETKIIENVIVANNLYESSSPSLVFHENASNVHSVHSDDNVSSNNVSISSTLESADNLLYSFLNNDEDVDISEDHRKILFFILDKIESYDKQIIKEKECYSELYNKIADIEKNVQSITGNLQSLSENKYTNNNIEQLLTNFEDKYVKIWI